MDFTADHHVLLSAVGDSAIWVGAVTPIVTIRDRNRPERQKGKAARARNGLKSQRKRHLTPCEASQAW